MPGLLRRNIAAIHHLDFREICFYCECEDDNPARPRAGSRGMSLTDLLSVAASNLLSPMVLFFALGFGAALAKSDLTVPEAVAKGLALYLMLAIGFKGGVELSRQGMTFLLVLTLASGAVLSFVIPFIAFTLLRLTTALKPADAAAVSAHYGSISVVTFVAGTEFVRLMGVPFDGYIVAVMAIMETPAIVAGLWLARSSSDTPVTATPARRRAGLDRELAREILLNGSVVLLMGAFAIGWITGDDGMRAIAPFIEAPFKGVLCLFLLDMGLIAANRLRGAKGMSPPLFAFGVYMPLLGASLGIATAWLLGLGLGETALLGILCGSASYIAVPAAMRLALPEASPSIYLTMSLAITFPFNLSIGIPLYFTIAQAITAAPG